MVNHQHGSMNNQNNDDNKEKEEPLHKEGQETQGPALSKHDKKYEPS